jgi:hypothetical protein
MVVHVGPDMDAPIVPWMAEECVMTTLAMRNRGVLRAACCVLLVVTACSTSGGGPPDEQDAARAHAISRALANRQLLQHLEAFEADGWQVASREDTRVDWGAGAIDDSSMTSAAVTRVRLRAKRPAAGAAPAMVVDLVVAWTAGGDDIFALAPGGTDSLKAVEAVTARAATTESERTEAPALDALAAPPAAACGRESAACSGGTGCCRGLSCIEIRDNHPTCTCSRPLTASYPESATTSIACFSLPENPIGAAYILRTTSGCGCCDLGANACGKPVSLPQYVRSSSTQLICLFTPGPIC